MSTISRGEPSLATMPSNSSLAVLDETVWSSTSPRYSSSASAVMCSTPFSSTSALLALAKVATDWVTVLAVSLASCLAASLSNRAARPASAVSTPAS